MPLYCITNDVERKSCLGHSPTAASPDESRLEASTFGTGIIIWYKRSGGLLSVMLCRSCELVDACYGVTALATQVLTRALL